MHRAPYFYALIVLCSFSCAQGGSRIAGNEQSSQYDGNEVQVPDQHNSQNVLDWHGVYRGLLPCPDCEAIKTEIRLYSDLRFVKNTQYASKDPEVFEQSGSFDWLEGGNVIRLADGSFFKVGENFLEMLNQEGNPMTSDLGNKYLLVKDHHPLDKTWHLVELNGEKIISEAKPHIQLHSKDSLLSGSGGCNRLKSSFHLAVNKLHFDPIAHTEKYCMNIDYENTFIQNLSKTHTFLHETDLLYLFDSSNNQSCKFEYRYFE